MRAIVLTHTFLQEEWKAVKEDRIYGAAMLPI